MSESAKQSFMNNKLFWKIVVLLIQFVAVYLPPFGQMTTLGMHILFILIGTIIGWVFIDLGWPSVSGIIALGISGAYESMGDALAACLGSQTQWMVFGALLICAFVAESGLADVIAGFLLNLKISRRSPFMMSFFFFIGAYVVAAVSACQIAVLLFIGLYRGIAEKAGVKAGDLINSYWLCGLALCSVFGEMFPPYKISMIILLNIYNSAVIAPLSALQGILWGIGGSLILTLVYILFCKIVLRIDLSRFDPNVLQIKKVNPSKEQKTMLWYILAMVILLVVPSIFSTSAFPLFIGMNYLGFGGLMLILVVVMMTIPVNGKPLLDMTTMGKGFSWGVFWMAAFYTTISGFISKPEVGISATLSSWFAPLLQVLPAVVFVILAIYLSMILSNFLNNMVVALVFISAIMALSSSIEGINLAAATMAIYLGSNCAIGMPSANPVNAITFSNTDLISFKNQSKLGWLTGFMMATVSVVLYFIMAIFFNMVGLV